LDATGLSSTDMPDSWDNAAGAGMVNIELNIQGLSDETPPIANLATLNLLAAPRPL
jgi:hypothetical protein